MLLLSGRLRYSNKEQCFESATVFTFLGESTDSWLSYRCLCIYDIQYNTIRLWTPCMPSQHFCLYSIIWKSIIFQSDILVTWVQKRCYILHITKTCQTVSDAFSLLRHMRNTQRQGIKMMPSVGIIFLCLWQLLQLYCEEPVGGNVLLSNTFCCKLLPRTK